MRGEGGALKGNQNLKGSCSSREGRGKGEALGGGRIH
jgi:hypothetical protein